MESFFLSKDEGLASLERVQSSSLADGTLELEGNLLGGLCLLSEDGFGLPSEASLLRFISSISQGFAADLTFLVLRHLVDLVLLAFAAVCSLLLGTVDLSTKLDATQAYHLSNTNINIK